LATNLKHEMDRLTVEHGYAAPAMWLAAVVGWQARWYRLDKQERVMKAARFLAEAAGIIEQLEKEEEAEPHCTLAGIG
jgi:transcription initiation factor TFIID subunit TAF12